MSSTGEESPICAAIRECRVLEFDYHGAHRIAEPYLHGWNKRGVEALRAVQVGGVSPSGGFGFGKHWIVREMSNVRVGSATFVPNDPKYNPNDSAMSRIHCRVER